AANGDGIGDPQGVIEFVPSGGTFSGTGIVELSSANPAAVIHYTTDGSQPTQGSLVYNSTLNLSETTEIRAIAVVPGEEVGPVNSESYIRLGNDVANFESPLPIIILENFNGGAIPDKRASNPPAGDGGGITQVDRQAAHMTLIDRPVSGETGIADTPNISSRIGIRVRGSSSASQPAKHENYSVETWGALDEDEVDIEPFAMPADNDWVLYAPYNYDRALVRNALIYELSRRMGHYASRTQFVEVFINTNGGDLTMGDYAGVYVFMEKIKQSKERVDVEDFSVDGSTGGWMIESNRKDPLPVDGSGTPPFNFHTAGPNRILQGPYGGSSGADQGGDDIPTGYNTFLNYVEPTGYDTSQGQRDSIVGWFDSFEDALYGSDYRRPDVGYRSFLDVESFIDHYLLVNFSRSVDGLQLSTFMYRPDTYAKLHLNPVWDYDRSMDSYDGRDNSTTGMWGQQFLWFPRLFSDPEFDQNHIDRWQDLRREVLSTANINSLIDEMAAEITEPVAAANFARWNASNNRPRSGGWPAEIAHLKNWLGNRTAWIDGQYLSVPVIAENAGEVTISSTDSGTIYYTLDGSDPRLPDFPGSEIELLAEGAAGKGLIPTENLGESWKGGFEPFDESSWLTGNTGIGFDYPDYTGIDVGGMRGNVGSAYLRVPFELNGASLTSLNGLVLNLRYEDGFVAYLNGVEVASDNKPGPLNWDSTTGGVSRSDSLAVVPAEIDLSAHLGALKSGTNILAIQAMNSSVNNNDVLASPQLVGTTGSTGGPSSQAQVFTSAFDLTNATKVTARLRDGGDWSGPVDATFLLNTIPADATNLVISEIMYRPADATSSEVLAGVSDRDEFEFIELLNINSTETLHLTGVKFVEVDLLGDRQGIEFDFADADIRFLAPGERLVVVESRDAFVLRYGNSRPVAGQYSGALSNDGEQITLLASDGNLIHQFTYNDQAPWPVSADGGGGSLVLVAPFSNPDHGDPICWGGSLAGSPGGDNSIPFTGTAGVDADRDGLDALVEYALGSSDLDAASGPGLVKGETLNGEFVFSYTLSTRSSAVKATPEFSTDLVGWSSHSSGLELIERTENGDGTETFRWRPLVPAPQIFLRLNVSQ
ncbi:MAG: CotH kinase family protein, partial [Akkermansiaceae bacterium]|nr:CotH kinase family protein [Akkermansiaceae bacterium]